jgi:hypothetical protein
MEKSKDDIAYEAMELGVPLHETWSCYKGDEAHCGRCGTCVERLEAINNGAQRHWDEGRTELGGLDRGGHPLIDKTEYEDRHYWKGALTSGPA